MNYPDGCPIPDKERESKTWLSEHDGPVAELDTLLARCAYFALSQSDALTVLAQVHAAVSAWRDVAQSPDVGLSATELHEFAPAFEHEQMNTAARLLREQSST